jgi:hypothetical protein
MTGKWTRTRCNTNNTNCVEVEPRDDGTYALRSSLKPDAEIVVTGEEWASFIGAVKVRQFDGI